VNTTIDTVWKHVTPELTDELVAFWQGHKAIASADEARQRAQQAVVTVRNEAGAICGVATAIIKVTPRLRQPTYYYRIFLAPAMRGHDVFLPMVRQSKQALHEYNRGLDRPESLGLLFEIENGKLGKAYPHAYEPTFDATFIGYSPRGKQLHVSYFSDAMLQTPARIAVNRDVRRNPNQSIPAQQSG